MDVLRRLTVPTGDILVVSGEHGHLECLSLGDYGKAVNVKADFMGLSRDPGVVTHTDLLPLEHKWVITVSTQYGCSMGCPYCDVPKVGPGRNATLEDLAGQIVLAKSLHPEVTQSDRLNVHFARMGEPTWNPAVIACAEWLRGGLPGFNVHPVVSTMMPRHNGGLPVFIYEWMRLKNGAYQGNAGLQISVNSTDEREREFLFHGNALTLADIAHVMAGNAPEGRKVTLNFAVAGYQIDPSVLLRNFDPAHYLVKLTPMHKTQAAGERGIATGGDYTTLHPYQADEDALKSAGYDVLVFVASEAEDLGRITCGNAILAGTMPEVPYTEVV
jgi:23S rRNA (adenine2503-C2)-methyltransferase